MESETTTGSSAATLQRAISPLQFVLLGFGSIVGTGWVVLLGGWLKQAGPGGAFVGIAAGGMAMSLVAAFYAELGSRLPQTGGDVTYINAVFGKKLAFLAGWILTLSYVSTLVFEGVAVAWLLELIWPALANPVLYSVLGRPISLSGLLVSLASGLTIATMNYRGARSFVRFQNILTGAFLAIVLVIIGVELCAGSSTNMHPVWENGTKGNWLLGVAWVFSSAPYIFGNFQTILQAIEERSQSTTKEAVVRLVLVAVGGAVLFYLLVLLGAIRGASWVALSASDLPAIAALAHLPWTKALTMALLVALIASVLKTWSAVFMVAVRLLLAQAREGMIPAFFGSINPKNGSPDNAVIVVAVVNLVGLFFGKGVIEPIVNTTALCTAICYALCCAATLALRKRNPDHVGFRVPGGTPVAILAVIFAAAMAVLALIRPVASVQANEFKWILLGCWAVLGLGLYRFRNRAGAAPARAVLPE
jgi:amino acid transporter